MKTSKQKQHFTVYTSKNKLKVLAPSSWIEKELEERVPRSADSYLSTLNNQSNPFLAFLHPDWQRLRLALVDGSDFEEWEKMDRLAEKISGEGRYSVGIISHEKFSKRATVTLPLIQFIRLLENATKKP